MAYWTDDRNLDIEQRRLDAQQADAKRKMDAVAAEREACAKIAEAYVDPIDIAHHIRMRGKR